MSTLSEFGLVENPFRQLPDIEISYWAGLPETRKALADVVKSVRPNDVGASEFVILQGDYGAGKTHALRYFAHEINTSGDGKAVYLSEVRSSKGLSFSAISSRIYSELETIETQLANHIRQSVEGCKAEIKAGASHPEIISTEVAIEKHVKLPEDRKTVQSLCKTGKIPNFSSHKDDYETVQGFASVVRVMTSPIGNNIPAFSAVYLFLDEVETAIDEKAALQVSFFQALRSLINAIPEHFSLVLSFTIATAVLEAAVPAHLQQRMTRPYILCEQLQTDSAKRFIKEYLGFFRCDGFSPPQPYYPFSEAAINAILERETSLMPRKIIYHLRRIWQRSVQEDLKPHDEISEEIANNILDGVI